jgi:hypothetical protein
MSTLKEFKPHFYIDKVRTCGGHDGSTAYSAELWYYGSLLNGATLVGTIIQDGWGGGLQYEFSLRFAEDKPSLGYRDTYAKLYRLAEPIVKEFANNGGWDFKDGETYESKKESSEYFEGLVLEVYLEELVNDLLEEKEIKSRTRKSIWFRTKAHPKGEYSSINRVLPRESDGLGFQVPLRDKELTKRSERWVVLHLKRKYGGELLSVHGLRSINAVKIEDIEAELEAELQKEAARS